MEIILFLISWLILLVPGFDDSVPPTGDHTFKIETHPDIVESMQIHSDESLDFWGFVMELKPNATGTLELKIPKNLPTPASFMHSSWYHNEKPFVLVGGDEIIVDVIEDPCYYRYDMPIENNTSLEISYSVIAAGTWKLYSPIEFDKDHPCYNMVFDEKQINPPLEQFQSGIPFDEIQCKENLVLVQKYDGTPACVTESTKHKLVERGWTDSTMSTKSNECSTDMKEYPLSKPLSDVYANRLVLFMQPDSTASFCVYYKSNHDNMGTRDITPALYTGEILLERYEGSKVSVDVEPKNVPLERGTEMFVKFTVTTTQNSTGVYHIGIPQLSRLPLVVWEDRQSVGANEIPVYSGFRSSGNIVLDAALLWHEEDDSLNYSVAEIRR